MPGVSTNGGNSTDDPSDMDFVLEANSLFDLSDGHVLDTAFLGFTLLILLLELEAHFALADFSAAFLILFLIFCRAQRFLIASFECRDIPPLTLRGYFPVNRGLFPC